MAATKIRQGNKILSALFPQNKITSASTCTGHCTTALGDDVCRSCLRTFEEVLRWVEMSEEERIQVNTRIAIELSRTQNPSYKNPLDSGSPG